jgi:hypothetical protein
MGYGLYQNWKSNAAEVYRKLTMDSSTTSKAGAILYNFGLLLLDLQ